MLWQMSLGFMALAFAADAVHPSLGMFSPLVPVKNVFDRGEAGYYCIKIPYLTSLPSGGLMALGEARSGSCSDFTKTDLVIKRSHDSGKTWSKLEVFHSGGPGDTIGNAAPVVKGHDVVVLFNLNNSKVLMKRSKDQGITWGQAADISSSTTRSDWRWVGLGPPSGLLLSSGRLLVPAYHTTLLNPKRDDGLVSKGHALLSDDGGHTWRISADADFGGFHFPNEDQAVEFHDGRVAIFSRGLGLHRLRTISLDGGEHWGKTESIRGFIEPIDGCEGSTVRCPHSDRLVYSGPVSLITRRHMSIYVSDDEGKKWHQHAVIDPGCSAYSSLAWQGNGQLGILYERCNKTMLIFEPDLISYASLPSPCNVSSAILV